MYCKIVGCILNIFYQHKREGKIKTKQYKRKIVNDNRIACIIWKVLFHIICYRSTYLYELC